MDSTAEEIDDTRNEVTRQLTTSISASRATDVPPMVVNVPDEHGVPVWSGVDGVDGGCPSVEAGGQLAG